jgi:hypothetical protein
MMLASDFCSSPACDEFHGRHVSWTNIEEETKDKK